MKLRVNVVPVQNILIIELDEDNFRIQTIKEKLSKLISVDETRLRLFFCGDELQDIKNNLEYGIVDDSMIRLVIAPHSKYSQINSPNNQIEKPRVKEVLPNRGTIHGGQKIKISGLNLPNSFGWVVSFGSTIVPAMQINETELECITPAHSPGTVSVEISHNGVTFTDDGVVFTFMSFEAQQPVLMIGCVSSANPHLSIADSITYSVKYRGNDDGAV